MTPSQNDNKLQVAKEALEKVADAWNIPGPVQSYHRKKQRELIAEWPTLYQAVKDVTTALSQLEKQEDECDCCGWDDTGYQHEPYCSAITKPLEEQELQVQECKHVAPSRNAWQKCIKCGRDFCLLQAKPTEQDPQESMCVDPRGNKLCTNGKDTYHEFNMRADGCYYCGYIAKELCGGRDPETGICKGCEVEKEIGSSYCACKECGICNPKL